MQCQEVQKRLGEFYDDELSVQEKKAVEKHLSICRPCMEEYQALAGIMLAAKEAMTARPAAKYWESLPHRIAARIPANAEMRPGWRIRLSLAKYRFVYGIVGAAFVLVLLFFAGKDNFLVRNLGTKTEYVPSYESLGKETLELGKQQRIVQKKKLAEKRSEGLRPARTDTGSQNTAGQHESWGVNAPQDKRSEELSYIALSTSKPMNEITKENVQQNLPPETTAALVGVDSGSLQPHMRGDLNAATVGEAYTANEALSEDKLALQHIAQDREKPASSSASSSALAKGTKSLLTEPRSSLRTELRVLFRHDRALDGGRAPMQFSNSLSQTNEQPSLVLADTLAALRCLSNKISDKNFAKESAESVFSDFLQLRLSQNLRNTDQNQVRLATEGQERSQQLSEAAELFYRLAVSDSLTVMKPVARQFFQSERDALTAIWGNESYQLRLRQLE